MDNIIPFTSSTTADLDPDKILDGAIGKLQSVHVLSELILQGVLGKTSESFGRFRHLHLDKDHLVVETRCGGPNREPYQSMYDEMQAHPLFDYYKDDDFDDTYAYFFFRYPPNIAEQIKCIVKSQSTGEG